ncbi:MAG TPA: carbohydrate ABC transporter permease [Arsenicitalea sp.]|jgi:ABC-type glycerol-3-phosphate transport system permease component|nr:carbohydrate ABC transporter permease [Arsenicitalea sp.]
MTSKPANATWPTYLLALIFTVAAAFPFVWMAISSLKTSTELYSVPPTWLPHSLTFQNYMNVLFNSNIPRYFLNSVVISVGASLVAILLAILAAYGFARFRFAGKRALQASILVSQLLPTATVIVPLYIIMSSLGLINTYAGLIIVYLIHTLPLCVWMLIGYFRAIPYEVEEAALIDGASRLMILFRIVLPLSIPGLVSTLVYSFVSCWNEFIFALVFATDSSVKTLPIGLAEFTSEFNTDWGAVMAASMLMTLPIVILFFGIQRLFVGGMTAGATKG